MSNQRLGVMPKFNKGEVMENISILIEDIKSAVRKYVREIVREEVRAVLNVNDHKLIVVYRLPDSGHRPPETGRHPLTYTKPKTLQFMGDYREIGAWNELLPALGNILGNPYQHDYNRDARNTWLGVRDFLTKCGYTCGTDEYEDIDATNQSVSIKVTRVEGN